MRLEAINALLGQQQPGQESALKALSIFIRMMQDTRSIGQLTRLMEDEVKALSKVGLVIISTLQHWHSAIITVISILVGRIVNI